MANCKYIPMVEFLQEQQVCDRRAVTVIDVVDITMKTFVVPINKVIGLGSDGASVMASDIKGVNCICALGGTPS